MSTSNESNEQRIKVFTRWVSRHLSKERTNVKVKDITKDLKNGVAVVELAEMLVGMLSPDNWSLSPINEDDMIQNCELAIDMFIDDGVIFDEITGKDINENKEEVILDFVWILILYYSINRSFINSTSDVLDELMKWALDRTTNYPNVKDFRPINLAILALLNSYYPDKIKFYSLDPNDTMQNSELAIKHMKDLKIPVFLDLDDLQGDDIDEKSLLTQLASIRIVLEKINQKHFKSSRPASPRSRRSSLMRNSFDNNQFIPEVIERSISIENELNIEEDEIFIPHQVEGDNSQYAGRKFGLLMTLNKSDYNNGEKMNFKKDDDQDSDDDEEIQLALALMKDGNPYLNPAGRMLDITKPDIENDVYQQFTFGKNEWNTVVDSFIQKGMVWDVSDQENLNPPAGTPFYVFPFHGRHNHHFVYKNNMLYAKQNGHVVTYVGGDEPFVMMPPYKKLKSRQSFEIQLL